MRKVLLLASLAPPIITAVLPAQAVAQQMITNASPLDPADPLRRSVEGLVNLIFAGKLAEAKAHMKANAAQAASNQGRSSIDQQVASLSETFGGGGFSVSRYINAGPGLVVVLGENADGLRSGLVLQVEPAPPHRLIEVEKANVGNGGRR